MSSPDFFPKYLSRGIALLNRVYHRCAESDSDIFFSDKHGLCHFENRVFIPLDNFGLVFPTDSAAFDGAEGFSEAPISTSTLLRFSSFGAVVHPPRVSPLDKHADFLSQPIHT